MLKDKGFKKIFLSVGFVILIISAILIGYNNFSYNKHIIIDQQQNHLLTIAKSISRSVDEFLKYRQNEIIILAKNSLIRDALRGEADLKPEFKDLLDEFGQEIGPTILYDEKGNLICRSSNTSGYLDMDMDVFREINQSKKGLLSKEYLTEEHGYSMNIVEPIMDKEGKILGFISNRVDLNKMYEDLIYPIRPGKKGYAMVKNVDGYILMHTAGEQVGTESIDERKKKFPQYDWSDLEDLNRKQIEEKEGYQIYNSRWWQEDEHKGLSKKMNAYTSLEKDQLAWIISVQMDYEEIEDPIRGYIINSIVIAVIMSIILTGGLYVIFKINKRRRELEMETLYLKELNQAWDELIKSEARLRHSQKLETVGTLTNKISHEFNNLLSPILGYSEILLASVDEKDESYEDILEINRFSLRLKELIGQLLSFSRGEDDNVKFEYIEINQAVKTSLNLIKHILPHEFKIVENLDSNDLINGNITQIQQVLMNLYINAYHAMDKGEGILRVDLRKISIENDNKLGLEAGAYVKIEVEDNGGGMSEEILDRVFDYYFTTKEAGVGTGLGLPVVRGIVENHKGRIRIESKEGQGTKIQIYFPIV